MESKANGCSIIICWEGTELLANSCHDTYYSDGSLKVLATSKSVNLCNGQILRKLRTIQVKHKLSR